MRVSRLLIIFLIFAAPTSALAQTDGAARRAWRPFFKVFRVAVAKRDRKTLRKMLLPDFHYSSGHHRQPSIDAAFAYWDQQNGRGWIAFKRTLAAGSVPMARWWNNGKRPQWPSRVAPPAANRRINIGRDRVDWYAIFEFRPDGHWYCVIFKRCCD